MTRQQLDTKLKEFISQYLGKTNIGNTPENKGECVGLVMKWAEFLGLPHVWGHAKDLFNNAGAGYTKIENSDYVFPQAGDIITWDKNMGGGYGHTAVATGKNNGNKFEVLEQNNPTGKGVRLYTYADYSFVLGWLRPITSSDNTMDRRPHWFNLMNGVIWEIPYEKVTDKMVDEWVANYKSERERSHRWAVLCQKYFGASVDSNTKTVEMVIVAIQEAVKSSNELLAQQLSTCQDMYNTMKTKYYKKLEDISNFVKRYLNEP